MNTDELQKSKKRMKIIDTLMIIIIILFLIMIFGSCSLRCSLSTSKGDTGLVFNKPVIIEKTIDIKVLYHSITNEYFTYFIFDNQIFKHIGTDLYKVNEGLIISNVNSSLYYNENNKLKRIEIK